MQKPERKAREYLDWAEVQSYLEKKFPEHDWEELYDEFCEYGMVNNGQMSTYYTIADDLEEERWRPKTYKMKLIFEKEFEIDSAIDLLFSW